MNSCNFMQLREYTSARLCTRLYPAKVIQSELSSIDDLYCNIVTKKVKCIMANSCHALHDIVCIYENRDQFTGGSSVCSKTDERSQSTCVHGLGKHSLFCSESSIFYNVFNLCNDHECNLLYDFQCCFVA